jgi:cytochrome c553
MARDRKPSDLGDPWPRIGWTVTAAIVVISIVLGFVIVSRYQQNEPTLGLFSAICRSLGITGDSEPAAGEKPPLRTPTQVAWTGATLGQIAAGNAQHGAFIAMNCAACHGEAGVSSSSLFPTLAGMDAAVIYKQLDDYRTGKRLWGVMEAMAKALSVQDSADVAAYFAVQTGGLPALTGERVPGSGRSLRAGDPAKRLAFAGDPQRGIPPCSACHGPGGFKIGAPALQGQHAAYIERQLAAFAEGTRHNDIYAQMRATAKQLTPGEMQALATFYGTRTITSASDR